MDLLERISRIGVLKPFPLENSSYRKLKLSSRMAQAWGVQCGSLKGSQDAYGKKALWTGRAVRRAKLVGRLGDSSRIPRTQMEAAVSCARASSQRERQDLLRQTFFQDQTRWWDSRHQKRNPRSPDLWPKESGDALWQNKCYKPACADALLVSQDTQIDHRASAASSWMLSSHHVDQLIGPGCEMLFTPERVRKLCRQGLVKEAIEVLEVLIGMDSGYDKYLVYSVLKECVAKKDLILGGQVHALAFKMGFGSDTFLCNHFVRMYAGHGKLQEAMDVFRSVAVPDVFMWSSIISAHAKQGQAERAVELYQHMRGTMTKPDVHVLAAALQACAAAGDLQSGKQVHDDMLTGGMEHNMLVCNCLVAMYAKCGSLKDARKVFDSLGEKDVVTWNAMIAGYAKVGGMGQESLSLYSAMQNEGMAAPNAVTFVCLLLACANVGVSALETGKQLHSQLKDRGLQSHVGGSLVNMYVKCGSLKDARIVFNGLSEKDVVTWTTMIAGYAQQEGMGQEALDVFSAMHNESRSVPNAVTFVCLLQACASLGVSALEKGKEVHAQLKHRRLESDVVVGGSLVNMYVKCGSLKDARLVFDGLREKNVVIWTTMIAGYAHDGMSLEALNVYSAMHSEGGAVPDAITFACLLEACSNVGALQQGRQLHSEIRKGGLESDIFLGTCLVKMYAKCGRLDVSREIFGKLPSKDLATWNALLKGYAEHGEASMATMCFEELLKQGVQPNKLTYTCLFTACSHAGLVDQGQRYFKTMAELHGVEPDEQHYNCMVDLLGRSGHLDEAERMLRAPGAAGNAVGWTALLSACKSHGDAELGRRCFDHLVKLEPTDATAYLLLASMYANVGKWEEVDRIESMRKAAGARKVPGKACIEVKKEVHEFTVGEERSDVAATLRKMNIRVKEGGHVPQTQLVLRAVSEQEKEDVLCGHAEKLALAYGLLNTPDGSTLVVTKNLRMCNDCHSSTKIMSRLEKRDIVVRDGHKVHRFQNGACSCQDRP